MLKNSFIHSPFISAAVPHFINTSISASSFALVSHRCFATLSALSASDFLVFTDVHHGIKLASKLGMSYKIYWLVYTVYWLTALSFLAFDLLLTVDNIQRTLADSVENEGEVKSLEFPTKIIDSSM